MLSRYLIADYERRNFSVSQCNWSPGAKENIVAISSPANAEANGKTVTGTSTNAHALSSGRIAGIVVGSTVGLLLILVLAVLGKKKLTTDMDMEPHRKPELAASNAPAISDETSNANISGVDGGNNGRYEIDSTLYPGVELGAIRELQEMRSNEEVGHELANANWRVSELAG